MRGFRSRDVLNCDSGSDHIRAWEQHSTQVALAVNDLTNLGSRKDCYEMTIFLTYCPLFSQRVFLESSSASVGWMFPWLSIAREVMVCSPGCAPSQRYLNNFQE